jgi:phage tail sheath protein FI
MNRFAILDSPKDIKGGLDKVPKPRDTQYGAFYFPWIQVYDPAKNDNVFIPPSGHMAGIYARTDTVRGVHKAPANEIVRGALGLRYQITKGEQDILNPKGINCIRYFKDRGIRVWGARTISSDPSWRYLNVRRLFIMVEESIKIGTQWVVFEPNDQNLWKRVTRDVTAFMLRIYKSGALFGSTPEEAFYVKCDEETNPPEQVDAGQLVVEIGMAPVKPAEFVIFRISQWKPNED